MLISSFIKEVTLLTKDITQNQITVIILLKEFSLKLRVFSQQLVYELDCINIFIHQKTITVNKIVI